MLKPYLTRVVHDFLLALGIISLLLAVFLVGFLYYPEPSHRLLAGPDGYAEYARCLEEQRAVVGESVVCLSPVARQQQRVEECRKAGFTSPDCRLY